MSIELVMPSNQLILVPFSHLQSFPASGSFPMSQFFTSGGQSIGASALASVLPMNIQDRFPLGLTGLTSLRSKGLSRVFSNTTCCQVLKKKQNQCFLMIIRKCTTVEVMFKESVVSFSNKCNTDIAYNKVSTLNPIKLLQ